jgi:hypothetical protein
MAEPCDFKSNHHLELYAGLSTAPAPTRHLAKPADAWVFVDNSNLFLGAQWQFLFPLTHHDGNAPAVIEPVLQGLRSQYGAMNVQARRETFEHSSIYVRDTNIRTNIPEVCRLLEEGVEGAPLRIMGRTCVASERGDDSWVWQHYERSGYETFRRDLQGKGGKEHGVDGDLKASVMGVAMERGTQSLSEQAKPVMVLCTGDGNGDLGPVSFPKVAELVIKCGFRVQIWGWKIGMSTNFYELAARYPTDCTVHLFDDYAKSRGLTYRQASVPMTMPVQPVLSKLPPPGFHQFAGTASITRRAEGQTWTSRSRESSPPLSTSSESSPPLCTSPGMWSASSPQAIAISPLALTDEASPGCRRLTIRGQALDVCEKWVQFCGAPLGPEKSALKCVHHKRNDPCFLHLDTPICAYWIASKGRCPKPSCAYHHPPELEEHSC